NVQLSSSNQDIDEVVVVAFGTQKKVNLTGSVASVTPKQLAERPVTSLQNALQGVSPGITVISRPMAPKKGNNATLTVRGRSNLGTPGPMYIIGGIPATGAEFAAISAADISSMSVLKDAASGARDGSSAATGFTLVNPKRGGGGRALFGIASHQGWQSATFLPNLANSLEYSDLYFCAMKNAGKQTIFTDDIIEK